MQKDRKEALYLPAPFFMLRVPLFPTEYYNQFLKEKDLGEALFYLFKTRGEFRQAVLVASKELYNAMLKVEEKSRRKQEQLKSSLLKYFLRMTSRSTPFGLFSFVALGKWTEATYSNFDYVKLQKRARPDMEWLINIIDTIIENKELFPFLPFKANPLLTHKGDRIHLSYIRKKSIGEERNKISIRSTSLTKLILDFANAPITVDELEKRVFVEFPSLDRTKTRELIKQLIEQQVLISSLYPSLLTESPFDDFLKKISHLKSHTEFFINLQKIQDEIERYNQTLLDCGEDILLHLCQLMEKLSKTKNYLQIDLGYIQENISLPKQLKENLSEICEITWKLSILNGNKENHLKEYHTRFLEKYGFSRRIPLLELLDEDVLGIPEYYLNPEIRKSLPANQKNKWKKWLQTEWNLCLQEKRKEIVLTDALINQFFDQEPENTKAPLSFDLFCQIHAESPEMLNHGDYRINLRSLSPQAGNFFGRFLDLLGSEAQCYMKELYLTEEKLDKECNFTEISYFPLSARSANVAIHPNLRSHQLDLTKSEKNSIQLDEIYVGVHENNFYLTDKEGKKEWIFRSGNMLTSEISPIPIRFLKDISLSKYENFKTDFWRDFYDFPFLPRISYKNIILAAGQWNIDLNMLDAHESSSLSTIEENLRKWMERWEMPRFLLLTEKDNQLLLDRTCCAHIQEIVQAIKSKKNVRLIESFDQSNNSNWIHSTLGTHSSEMVFPLIRNPNCFLSLPSTPISKISNVPQIVRQKGIGSEWLYLKIYLSKDNHNHFLMHTLSALADFLAKENTIKQWFFVRYNDKEEGAHIRVRFQGEKEKILASLIPTIHDWSESLFKERLIKNLYFGTYEREIERYGGESLIGSIEDFFCCDSLTSLDLLKIWNKNKNIPIHVVAAVSLIDFTRKLSSILLNQFDPFVSIDEDKSELNGIREWKKTLSIYSSKDENALFYHVLQKREHQVLRLAQLIKEIDKARELSVSVVSIYHSLVHMHCNRLMGTDAVLEKKARLYAHYILKNPYIVI